MEKNEKMVKYAQELSKKLVESVKQPVAEAEIKQKVMAVSRPFNELKRRIGKHLIYLVTSLFSKRRAFLILRSI